MSLHCPWWIAWWHRRMRRIDRQLVVPAIVSADVPWVAFHLFTVQRGQEHWWCPCGDAERREVEDLLE